MKLSLPVVISVQAIGDYTVTVKAQSEGYVSSQKQIKFAVIEQNKDIENRFKTE